MSHHLTSLHQQFPSSRIKSGDAEAYMSTAEAAAYLRLSQEALRMRIYRKQIPAYKLGRQWRFKRSQLDLVLQANLYGKRP